MQHDEVKGAEGGEVERLPQENKDAEQKRMDEIRARTLHGVPAACARCPKTCTERVIGVTPF